MGSVGEGGLERGVKVKEVIKRTSSKGSYRDSLTSFITSTTLDVDPYRKGGMQHG